MSDTSRIYLDNAATSFPKPPSVIDAIVDYSQNLGAAVGRSATRTGSQVQAIVDRCRTNCARLLGVEDPRRVIFTFNGTDSLNLAIHGLLKPGDHVVTSAIEHNSVLRPLHALSHRGAIELTEVVPGADGAIDPKAISDAIEPKTALVICQHASNVTGVVHPIEDIGEVARANNIPICIDAAQTAGAIPLSFDDLPASMLACPGHKGLLGPLGTGLLLLDPQIVERLEPIRQGGTGSVSESVEQPSSLPDRFESGNHNAIGLVGLGAAVEYVIERGISTIQAHEAALTDQMTAGLRELSEGTAFCDCLDSPDRLPVFSISFAGLDAQSACSILDQEFQIETRAGLHCAPGAHRHASRPDWITDRDSGSVRFSLGAFSTETEVAAAIEAIRELASA